MGRFVPLESAEVVAPRSVWPLPANSTKRYVERMPVEPPNDVLAHHQRVEHDLRRKAETAQLLLDAARYLGETLEIERVYDRFHELLADAIQHDGVVVSSFDEHEGLIRAEYVWVEGQHVDPATLPELKVSAAGGMQSEVIRTGRPLLENDVGGRVAGDEGGTFYDVDREGTVRKLPDTGPTHVQAAMMVPVKHEGRVVGVVQLMSDERTYTEEDLEVVEGLAGLMAGAVRMARLETERRRAEASEAAAQAVAAEREQAARLLGAVGDGIFYVRRDGIVRFWNRSAELITGLQSEDVRDRHAKEVVPGWEAITDQVAITEGDEVARVVRVPVEIGGRELWLSFVAVGRREGVVYAFRDMTAERELEQAKSDFIATVSHELRTPMTAVYGAARTLLRPELDLSPEQRTELLEMIATQSERLAQITEEVLLASRLDRGEVIVERDHVDVAELARGTVDAMQSHLGVDVTLDASQSAFATGDRDRIQQILINLLDNAAKFSPRGGGITVSVSQDAEHVRLAVADEGVGIAPSEQQAIFEKFYRVDPHLTETPGGTGLGLYICGELAGRMDGNITVESEPGRGSTFALELPRG
jgi:PAS domain S-box-containing protein